MDYQGTAYSLLSIKSVNDEKRIVTGMASTPTADRMSDVVEPLGAKFKTPMPFMLYHDSRMPVGTVDFAKATKTGIPFEASLPNVVEPGIVQDRVNEALHSLKYKLLACVSIGFRALEDGVELLKTGGLRFTSWEWLELTLCAIPANPDAVIHSFKSMDVEAIHRALGTHPSNSQADRDQFITAIKSADQAARRASSGANSGHRVVRLDDVLTGKSAPGASGQQQARIPGVVYLTETPKGNNHG